jgi:hypothetical protein
MRGISYSLLLVIFALFYGCGGEDSGTGDFSTPTTSVPSVPDVSVPEVTVPEVSVPEVTVPEVSVPEVSVPEVTTPEDTVVEVRTEDTTPDVTVPEETDVTTRATASTGQSGVFVDTIVEGLSVTQFDSSGVELKTTDPTALTTSVDGTFTVLEGATEVEFSISNLIVGRAKADLFSTADGKAVSETVVTLVDMFNTESIYDSRVRFVARVLLSLDSDGNQENGIQIPEVLPEGFDGLENVDFSLQGLAAEQKLKELFGDSAIVSDISAEDHLKNSVIELEKVTTVSEASTDVCPNGGLIREYKVDFNNDRVYETYSTVHCDKTSETERTTTYKLEAGDDENCPNGGIRIHHKKYVLNERAKVARLIADYNSYKCEAAYYTVTKREAKSFDTFSDSEGTVVCSTGGVKYGVQKYRQDGGTVGDSWEEVAHCNNDDEVDSTIQYNYVPLEDGNKHCPNGGIRDEYYNVVNGIMEEIPFVAYYVCNSQDDGFYFGEHKVEAVAMKTKEEDPYSICPFGGTEYQHTSDYDNSDITEPTIFSDYECINATPENMNQVVKTIPNPNGVDLNGDGVVEWFQATGSGTCPFGGNVINYKNYVGDVFHSEFNTTKCFEGAEIVITEVEASENDEVLEYRPIIIPIGPNSYGLDGDGICEYQGGKIVTTKVLYNGYVNYTYTDVVCNDDSMLDKSSTETFLYAFMVDADTKCSMFNIQYFRKIVGSAEEPQLSYEENVTRCEAIREEENPISNEPIKARVGASQIVASDLEMYCDDDIANRTNGSIEIVGDGSSIDMISYDEEFANSLNLTVFKDGYSKIIYFYGTALNSEWQKLFRSVNIISSYTGTYKVVFTVGNENAQNVHLGTDMGVDVIDGNIEQWGTSNSGIYTKTETTPLGDVSVITKGYTSETLTPLGFVDVATSPNKLANHVSIGLGVQGDDNGQIDGKSSDRTQNEKIEVDFGKPVTNIKIGLTGIGGNFIYYDYTIESENFTNSREYGLYNKHNSAYEAYKSYLEAKSGVESAESEKVTAESEKSSAEAELETAQTDLDSATATLNSATGDEVAQAQANYETVYATFLEKQGVFNSANDKFVTASTNLINKTVEFENARKLANDKKTEYDSLDRNYKKIAKEYQSAIDDMEYPDDIEEMERIFAENLEAYLALSVLTESETPDGEPEVVEPPAKVAYYEIYKDGLKNGELANARVLWTTYYEDQIIESGNLYRDTVDLDNDGREATKRVDTTVPTTKVVFEMTTDNNIWSNYSVKYIDAEFINMGSCEEEVFSKTYTVTVVNTINVIIPERKFTYYNAERYAKAKGYRILSIEDYKNVAEFSSILGGLEYWTSDFETETNIDSGEILYQQKMLRVNSDGYVHTEPQDRNNYKYVAFEDRGNGEAKIPFSTIKSGDALLQGSWIEAQARCNENRKRVPTVAELTDTYFANLGTDFELPLGEFWTTTPAPEAEMEDDGWTFLEDGFETSDSGTGTEDVTAESSEESYAVMFRVEKGSSDFFIEERMSKENYKNIICIGNSAGANPMVDNIVGRVLDDEGMALEGVKVSFGSNYTFTTNSSGTYSIVKLPAGEYVVSFEKEGYKTVSKTVKLYSNGVSVETATLTGKEKYIGWVKPVTGDITVTYASGETETVTPNSSGEFRLSISREEVSIISHGNLEISDFNFEDNKFWVGNGGEEIILQKEAPVVYNSISNGCYDTDASNEAFDNGYCDFLNVNYETKVEFGDDQNPIWSYSVTNNGSKSRNGDIDINEFLISLSSNTIKYLPTSIIEETTKYSVESSGLKVIYSNGNSVLFGMADCPSEHLIYDDGVKGNLKVSFSNGEAISIEVPVPVCKTPETRVSGTVTNTTGNFVEGAKVFVNYRNSDITEDVYTHTDSNGEYSMYVKQQSDATINVVYTEEVNGREVDIVSNGYIYERNLGNRLETGNSEIMEVDLKLESAVLSTICTDEVVEDSQPSLDKVDILLTGQKRVSFTTGGEIVDDGLSRTYTGCAVTYLPLGEYEIVASKSGYETKIETITVSEPTSYNITLAKDITNGVTRDYYYTTAGSCYIGSSYEAKLLHITSGNSSYEFNYDVQRVTGNELLKEFRMELDTSCIKDVSNSGVKTANSITWATNGGNLEFNTIQSDEYTVSVGKVDAQFITEDGFILYTKIEAPICQAVTTIEIEFSVKDESGNAISGAEIEVRNQLRDAPLEYEFTGVVLGTGVTDENGIAKIRVQRSYDEGVVFQVRASGFETKQDTSLRSGDTEKSVVLAVQEDISSSAEADVIKYDNGGFEAGRSTFSAEYSYDVETETWTYKIEKVSSTGSGADLSHWYLDLDSICLQNLESVTSGSTIGVDGSTSDIVPNSTSVLKWDTTGGTFSFKIADGVETRIGSVPLLFKAGNIFPK